MNDSPRSLRVFRSRPASRKQGVDLVVLAHIKDQSRLSRASSGRPMMIGELEEVGIDVGHRRVGRLTREDSIVFERIRKFKGKEDQKAIRVAAVQHWAGNRTSRAARQIAASTDVPVIDIAGGMMRVPGEGCTPVAPMAAQGCTIS